jgi:simple sugar transport system permease protein
MKPLFSITSPPRAEPMTKCIARAGAAMRVNGILTWLMVDQVGNNSVTSDINGALGDTVKYSAFGEVRAGGTATDYVFEFSENMAQGRGFTAFTVMVFGASHPVWTMIASFLFGFADALGYRLQLINIGIPPKFIQMFPTSWR